MSVSARHASVTFTPLFRRDGPSERRERERFAHHAADDRIPSVRDQRVLLDPRGGAAHPARPARHHAPPPRDRYRARHVRGARASHANHGVPEQLVAQLASRIDTCRCLNLLCERC
eukprot:4934832-Pleurochrysis_carterae.AAC.2